MATTQTRKGKTTAPRNTAGKSTVDAIQMLEADHREIRAWFKDYDRLETPAEKDRLSEKICLALKVHMQVEEEILYPASREALKSGEEDMIDEAVIQHGSAKALIGEIEQMEVDEDLYDARLRVLGEVFEHHVGEEEKDHFPACRRTDMDLTTLGEQMAARKTELMRKLARPNGHRVM